MEGTVNSDSGAANPRRHQERRHTWRATRDRLALQHRHILRRSRRTSRLHRRQAASRRSLPAPHPGAGHTQRLPRLRFSRSSSASPATSPSRARPSPTSGILPMPAVRRKGSRRSRGPAASATTTTPAPSSSATPGAAQLGPQRLLQDALLLPNQPASGLMTSGPSAACSRHQPPFHRDRERHHLPGRALLPRPARDSNRSSHCPSAFAANTQTLSPLAPGGPSDSCRRLILLPQPEAAHNPHPPANDTQ